MLVVVKAVSDVADNARDSFNIHDSVSYRFFSGEH
jgi:hypothetical protein